ncbi:GNAT family N-acetyltransferase [Kitasatospora sp. NPDC057198]|uniref:GNAT family N-acetyltransferase n=1 Tax=Kitasatospora sp. NPDC057198 TaxID=3346046 RepID=UPI003625E630
MSTFEAETIRTERLTLLPLRPEHAEELAVVLSDPALHVFIGGAPEEAVLLRARYERWAAGAPDPSVSWCNWAVRLRDEECLVGTVQATVTADGDGAVAEIAWTVGTPWQRRGIASEAALGLVGRLRGHGVRTVVAHVHPEHAASAAVAAAAGLAPTDRWQDGEVRWESVTG